MKIKIYFSCSEAHKPELDFELDLFHALLNGWLSRGCFEKCHTEIFFGDCHETQKEKACDKGICKQRRNKAVKNVSKSS